MLSINITNQRLNVVLLHSYLENQRILEKCFIFFFNLFQTLFVKFVKVLSVLSVLYINLGKQMKSHTGKTYTYPYFLTPIIPTFSLLFPNFCVLSVFYINLGKRMKSHTGKTYTYPFYLTPIIPTFSLLFCVLSVLYINLGKQMKSHTGKTYTYPNFLTPIISTFSLLMSPPFRVGRHIVFPRVSVRLSHFKSLCFPLNIYSVLVVYLTITILEFIY